MAEHYGSLPRWTTSRLEARILFILRITSLPFAGIASALTIVLGTKTIPSLQGTNSPILLLGLVASVWAFIIDFFEILSLWPNSISSRIVRRLPPPAMFINELMICVFASGNFVMFQSLYCTIDGNCDIPKNGLVTGDEFVTGVYDAIHLLMFLWTIWRMKMWWVEYRRDVRNGRYGPSRRWWGSDK